jgi:hypothetical protein
MKDKKISIFWDWMIYLKHGDHLLYVVYSTAIKLIHKRTRGGGGGGGGGGVAAATTIFKSSRFYLNIGVTITCIKIAHGRNIGKCHNSNFLYW